MSMSAPDFDNSRLFSKLQRAYKNSSPMDDAAEKFCSLSARRHARVALRWFAPADSFSSAQVITYIRTTVCCTLGTYGSVDWKVQTEVVKLAAAADYFFLEAMKSPDWFFFPNYTRLLLESMYIHIITSNFYHKKQRASICNDLENWLTALYPLQDTPPCTLLSQLYFPRYFPGLSICVVG